MQSNDVHHRLLPAPLAVFDEDIEDNKNNLTKIKKLFSTNRSSHPRKDYRNDKKTYKNSQRFTHRKKSSSIVVSNLTLNSIENQTNIRFVRIRLVFMHIGDIDTLNEKYHADIYFEARWIEKQVNINKLNLTTEQQKELLHENMTLKLDELNSIIHWSPQLFIENLIGQIGEQQKWFTIKTIVSETNQLSSSHFINIEICEHHRMKGVFWEKLELDHFPADVQDLTVSITSHHHIDSCILIQDDKFRSSINRQAFFDQQEWCLYEHVATEIRQTNEEYSFEGDNKKIEQKKHPILSITCRAARRPGYYYWNGFCLIFLITICSFCIFSILPNRPQSRLQITSTLLLTSITFRWVVNRSLPQISYLTTLDIYSIMSIVILVILCIWHSIIATIIFLNSVPTDTIKSTSIYVTIDRYVFIGIFIIYIILHIVLILWLIFVPYKRRREMKYLDHEYAAKKYIQLDTSQSRYGSKQDLQYNPSSSIFDTLPTIKSVQSMKYSSNIVMMSSASSFLPIKEETNENTEKAINMIKLRKQDDEYYDHTNNELKSSQKNTC